MNIGILFPRSDIHPGIGLEFMDGLKISLNASEPAIPVQFYTESIGFGGAEKEVYTKTEKLLLIDGVDVLLAFIDERVLEVIKPMINASGKLVVVVNAGANYPTNWVPQANIIHLTLQHAFLCSLTGALVAREKNKNGVVASSFYDCGYLHTAAMVKGFLEKGGAVTFNYISKELYRNGINIDQLTAFLSSNKHTSSLLCIFDAWPASLFYALVNKIDKADQLHLFASPMMFEPRALEHMGPGFGFTINGYIPWHAALENEANREFNSRYTRQTKKTPSIFSLLGWEAGLVARVVQQESMGDYADGTALVKKLEGIKLDSPRGKLKLDDQTQFYTAAPVRCSMAPGSNNLETIFYHDYMEEWKKFSSEPADVANSGWMNTYLCY